MFKPYEIIDFIDDIRIKEIVLESKLTNISIKKEKGIYIIFDGIKNFEFKLYSKAINYLEGINLDLFNIHIYFKKE